MCAHTVSEAQSTHTKSMLCSTIRTMHAAVLDKLFSDGNYKKMHKY